MSLFHLDNHIYLDINRDAAKTNTIPAKRKSKDENWKTTLTTPTTIKINPETRRNRMISASVL